MRQPLFALYALCFVFLAGCASVDPTPSAGFLNSYSRLESVDEKGLLRIYKSDEIDLTSYTKIIIEPVVVYLHSEAKANALDPKTLSELTDAFEEELKTELGAHLEVVDKQGLGVAVIKVALTDVKPNIALLNIHWTTSMSKHGMGGASMEAEISDSRTGELLFAIKDTRRGQSITFDKEIAKHYIGGLSKWGHTKGVFEQWAKYFAEQFGHGEEE